MNTTAEIFLWGTRIGIIHQELDRPYASFEYDQDFLKSAIEVRKQMRFGLVNWTLRPILITG